MAARKAKAKVAKGAAANGNVRSKSARKPACKSKSKASAPRKPKNASPSKRKTSIAATTPAEVIPFKLPERFDSAAAATVLDVFRQYRGAALTVDASAVRRVGAQGIQILISATRTWQADGHDLALENASAELIDAAQLLGLSHSDLSISGSLQ